MGFFSRRKKADLFEACFGRRNEPAAREPTAPAVLNIPVGALGPAPSRYVWHDGEKFPGGYGATQIPWTDYWTLRARSADLYLRNLYARGIIRRMVTNEINVGLHLEATPEEAILGYEQDGLSDWGENVENRFSLWANNPQLCDHYEKHTFGELQAMARRESLVVGDVLVVLRQDPKTRLPRIQLVNGARVQTPMSAMLGRAPNGNKVVHGVEIDSNGRHVAFHVLQDDGLTSKRLPARGEKSGRRLAWLVYGTDKRLDEVRGQPMLALILQALKEIDRYRDATLRKAVIASMLSIFIEKTQDKHGTRPLTNAGISLRSDVAADNAGAKRSFNVADFLPGVVLDELQVGETPKSFQSNIASEKFGEFERAIVQAFAWASEIPPEILMLSFNSNYSASQAAINEYKLYLNPMRTWFGGSFCTPIYHEWLLSETLDQRIIAPGMLEAWRDPKQYDTRAAWVDCGWAGNIKPAVDLSKLVSGYATMIAEGFITRDRAARELTGTKFSKNVQRLAIENKQLADANRVLAELEAASKAAPAPPGGSEGSPDDIDREDDAEEEDTNERAMIRVVARA